MGSPSSQVPLQHHLIQPRLRASSKGKPLSVLLKVGMSTQSKLGAGSTGWFREKFNNLSFDQTVVNII